MLLYNQHQTSKVSRSLYATCLFAHSFPSGIPTQFMALSPMTSVKRFPQANYAPKRYPTASFILHMVEKAMPPMTNNPYPASSFVFFGVAVHLPAKTQPSSAAHYTDSEFRTFYLDTKMVQWIRTILKNLGFQVSNSPTLIYEDIQPTIDIMKANQPTSRLKYIGVPINFVHGKYVLLTIDPIKLKPPFSQKI